MFKCLNSTLVLQITSVLVIIIINSNQISAETIVSESSEQNIGINLSKNKTIVRTTPKLVGIFADGLNDSNNFLNNSNFDFNINTDAQTDVKVTTVPIKPPNSDPTSDSINKDLIETQQNMTETNETQAINPCKGLDFETNSLTKDKHICILRHISNPKVPGIQVSDGKTAAIIPIYFHIPAEKEIQFISDKSYIAMEVEICSEPRGQVLIFDEGSQQQLLSFSNMGTTRMCNSWLEQRERFVSDSNMVRVEAVLPNGQSDAIFGFEAITTNPSPTTPPESRTGYRSVTDGKIFELKIRYYEIRFRQNEQQLLYPNNPNDWSREVPYLANSVVTYRLMPPPIVANNFSIGLQIYLEKIDIDIDSGDFVLIGPGDKPTHRELSKAQIIAENIDDDHQKNIWIDADSAYIRLVTHNSLKTGPALRFTWMPPNITLEDKDNFKPSDRIRNSAIQLCVLDSSCKTFNTSYKDVFKEEFVHISNKFLFKDNAIDTTNLVSFKSILIFNTEDHIRSGRDKNQIYCQMNVAIASPFDQNWPLISYNTLHHIFFGGSNYREMHSLRDVVKVTDCSQELISFWKIILPIIVILIVSIVLLFIAWRYQYHNWTRVQRMENSKYKSAPVKDPNEGIIYSKGGPKDNPMFVDEETHQRISNTRSMETIDGRPPPEHKKLTNELSKDSELSNNSSLILSSIKESKESPDFVHDLWVNPSTSRQQNPYVIDYHLGDDRIDGISSDLIENPIETNENYFITKSNTYSKGSDSQLPPIPITGLNGTQHESLRSYPRSALRRPTITSEEEFPINNETNPFRRPSKVQFELPDQSNKHSNDNSLPNL